MGQLVSLFGDRLHQLALVALVGEATQNGAFAVAMVFVAATVPNLVFGPLAGALVDRWDQKRVMVASDLLRAGDRAPDPRRRDAPTSSSSTRSSSPSRPSRSSSGRRGPR